MRAIRLAVMLFAMVLMARATPVAIYGVITFANGATPSGFATIQWQPFTNAQGNLIAGGSLNLPISNGVVSVSLEPNTLATPSGTSYSVVYNLSGSPVYARRWFVPSTNSPPVALTSVEFPSQGLVGQTAVVAPSQIITTGAVLGQCFIFNGSYAVWGTCASGSTPSFSAITAGTNTAALLMGTGGSLSTSGSGVINANQIIGTAITGLSGSGGKLLETTGTLTTGSLLSSTSGNAVDSGIVAANVMQTSSNVTCGQTPAFTGDVTKSSGSCATSVSTFNGGTPFGSAAAYNISISGAFVPLMSNNNSWSGTQSFTFIQPISSTAGGETITDGIALSEPSSGTLQLGYGDHWSTILLGSSQAPTNNASIVSVHGRADNSASAATIPNRTGTGSPVARDACTVPGETYFRTDAPTVGQNIYGCTAAGNPGTWVLNAGGPGSGTVTNTVGPLSAGNLIIGNAGTDVIALGSLGTSTTVLHGNSSGNPSWGAVVLTTDVGGILPAANGGLGTASIAFSGPSGGAKTFTLPNASSTILTSNTAVTLAQGGTGADLSAIVLGGLISGTASGVGITTAGANGTVLTADNTKTGGIAWTVVAGTGTVTSITALSPLSGGTITTSGSIGCASCVTSSTILPPYELLIGLNTTHASQPLGSLGGVTSVLHGNSSGPPSWGQVSLTADVSGILPVANGGIGSSTGVGIYVASETGSNNAIAGSYSAVTTTDGVCVDVQLGHTLQAGANTFNLNGGGAVSIKSHLNPANNIGSAYAATGRWRGCYSSSATAWLDMSQ